MEERKNTLTITIARNSDGEILRVVQGTSIFAGVADAEIAGAAYAIGISEKSNGEEALRAAEAAEKAIIEREKNDSPFLLIRTLLKLSKNSAKEEYEDDE